MDTNNLQPTIAVDTREPEGQAWEPFFTVPTTRVTLATGDYSVLGAEEWIGIERKTLPDLIACLSHSRTRFIEELRRAQRIPEFYVLVEASYQSLLRGDYQSQMNPKGAWESVIALQSRFRIPFLFAGNMEIAAHLCESILLRWCKEHEKALESCRRAQKTLKEVTK
jgi:ERCC4-type nuclease